MKGGARVRSGPPPDPNALRRDRDKLEWRDLPKAGRDGETPAWPPPIRPTKVELEMWARTWRLPQAIAWEELGMLEEVALYVRSLRVAMGPRARAADRTTVRQLMDSLGISLAGLARHRWRIVDEAGAPAAEQRLTGTDTVSAKRRFGVIDGGGS